MSMEENISLREQITEKIKNDRRLNESTKFSENGDMFFAFGDEHIEYHGKNNAVIRYGADASDLQEKKFSTEDSALHYFYVACEGYLAHLDSESHTGEMSGPAMALMIISFVMLMAALVLLFMDKLWGFFLAVPMFVYVGVLMKKSRKSSGKKS